MKTCVTSCDWCNGTPSALQWTEVLNLLHDLARSRPLRAKFFPTLPPCVKSSFNIVAQERCLRLKWLLRSEEEHVLYLQERWYALIATNNQHEFQLALDDCNFSYIQRHMAPSSFATNMVLIQHLMNRYVNYEDFRMQLRSRNNFASAYVRNELARRSLWMCAMITMDILPSKYPCLFGRKMPMSINPYHDYTFFETYLQAGYFVRMVNHPNLPYWLDQLSNNPLIFSYNDDHGLGQTLTSIFQTLKELHRQQVNTDSDDEEGDEEDSDDEEGDEEDSDNEEGDEEDSDNEEGDEEDSDNEEGDEEDSDNEEDDEEDSDNEEDDEEGDEEDSDDEEGDNEEGDGGDEMEEVVAIEDEDSDNEEDIKHFLAVHNINLNSDQDDDSSRSLSFGDFSDMEREHIPLLELLERNFSIDDMEDEVERELVVVSPTHNSSRQNVNDE